LPVKHTTAAKRDNGPISDNCWSTGDDYSSSVNKNPKGFLGNKLNCMKNIVIVIVFINTVTIVTSVSATTRVAGNNYWTQGYCHKRKSLNSR
jgi:hypothetical protein